MKIAITGHTTGLGNAFFTECLHRGHTVTGFSRTNGYNLADYFAVTRMLEELVDYDVFINNAKPSFAQTQILYRLAPIWENKLIISIGSSILEQPPIWTDVSLLEYYTQKVALNHAVSVLQPLVSSKLLLLNPPHLNDSIISKFVTTTLDAANI
jgi:hypothetical protein